MAVRGEPRRFRRSKAERGFGPGVLGGERVGGRKGQASKGGTSHLSRSKPDPTWSSPASLDSGRLKPNLWAQLCAVKYNVDPSSTFDFLEEETG